jgi:hypothetical protein
VTERNQVGFDAGEIRTDEPTRSARLKWVIVVDEALPPGRAANAAALAAATTAGWVTGLMGPDARDAAGREHPGLAWAGCAVLAAGKEALTAIREKAAASLGVSVADVPLAAQTTRVYDEYLRVMSETKPDELEYSAVSLVGPRNRIDKIVHRLPLLG